MSNALTSASLQHLLGIAPDTPMSIDGMCQRLRFVIYPAPDLSARLEEFCLSLCATMNSLGIAARSPEEAAGGDGRFVAGTVIFAAGTFPDELLAINRVSTLYNNIIVGIYDEPPPLTPDSLPQERLDAIVGRLARDMVHLLIFVTDRSWTICTMNGGVVTFNTPSPRREDVRSTLVPKLTAQVVPPRAEDIEIRKEKLHTGTAVFKAVAEDFLQCSALWNSNGSLLSHTSTAGLEYRNSFYKRIVARYLDQRSGMSYGFFARQMPVTTRPARIMQSNEPSELEGKRGEWVEIFIAGKRFLVEVPEVSVITTRSGCKKHDLDPQRDLVEIGLANGRAWLKTPEGVSSGVVKPSFDTLTILAHALGNAFAASLLQTLRPNAPFGRQLAREGASMTHWHDYPALDLIPEGYYLHGSENPPVSCSTPQSAAYSLLGKIEALEEAFKNKAEYHGDVHIEPHHGTNIVGTLSLTHTAMLLNPILIPEG